MRKITTRLISAALAASMMLSVCPVGAFAAEKAAEPENGVSTQAEEDITNQGINFSTDAPTEKTAYLAGTGTATYDPNSNTLTLNNATIETRENAIIAPDGILNIVVEGENVLSSTNSNAVYCTKKTTNINISGSGTLNINAGERGITDDDEQGSLSIKNTAVNFKCEDTAIYMANNIRFEGAKIDINGVDDPYGIEVFDGGLIISNSVVTVENVDYAFAVGRNNDSRISFEVLNNSSVTIENAHACTIASNAVIEDSTFIQKDSCFSREGSTTIKNSTFIAKTTSSTAFDSWYGGLEVSGDSYVELESARNAFKLAKTSECLTLGDGLAVLEGEMDAGMQMSTTARLVIGKIHNVNTVDAIADKTKAKTGEKITVTANEKPGKQFNGWSIQGDVTEKDESKLGTLTFTMPDGDVTITAKFKDITFNPGDPVNNEYTLTVQNGEKDAETSIVAMGKNVTLIADDLDGKIFTGWTVDGLKEFNETPAQVLTFTMPGNDVTAVAHYRAEDADEQPVVTDSGAGGVIAAVVLTAGAGLAGYELGLHLYQKYGMGIAYWPKDRMKMAQMIWEKAGKPEPVSTELFEDIDADDTDAQKAARWMVEQELVKLDEDKPAEFQPLKTVTRLRVCLTWHDAKEKGLVE